MSISEIAGSYSQPFDQQTFGAAVVSKTLDYMHGQASTEAVGMDKGTFGAAVVGKTLDYMNAGSNQEANNLYSFQKDVVQGYLTGSLLNQIV